MNENSVKVMPEIYSSVLGYNIRRTPNSEIEYMTYDKFKKEFPWLRKMQIEYQEKENSMIDNDLIEILGWEHDYNLDGEEYPSMFESHGNSKGFLHELDFDKNHTQYILFHFPTGYTLIEKTVNGGGEGFIFMGYIKSKEELKQVMFENNITYR